MSNKGKGVGECVKHGEYFLDAYDSPCPSCEDECNHPALYESCPDEGQGATWYCPDCESVVEIDDE